MSTTQTLFQGVCEGVNECEWEEVCVCVHVSTLWSFKKPSSTQSQFPLDAERVAGAEVVTGNASVKKARRGEVQMSGSYRQSLSRSHSGSLTRKKKKEGKGGARGQGAGRQSIFQGACERIQ